MANPSTDAQSSAKADALIPPIRLIPITEMTSNTVQYTSHGSSRSITTQAERIAWEIYKWWHLVRQRLETICEHGEILEAVRRQYDELAEACRRREQEELEHIEELLRHHHEEKLKRTVTACIHGFHIEPQEKVKIRTVEAEGFKSVFIVEPNGDLILIYHEEVPRKHPTQEGWEEVTYEEWKEEFRRKNNVVQIQTADSIDLSHKVKVTEYYNNPEQTWEINGQEPVPEESIIKGIGEKIHIPWEHDRG